MLLVTINHIPGKEYEVLGMVKGTVVQSKNFGKDFMAGMKTLVGGEIVGYTEMLNEGVDISWLKYCIESLNLDESLDKRTNALTVYTLKDSVEHPASACIHCGRCVDACPMGLDPTAFSKAQSLSKEEKMAKFEEGRINLCMECGCCSFVCPANRPIVQNNRLAKSALNNYKAHQSTLK